METERPDSLQRGDAVTRVAHRIASSVVGLCLLTISVLAVAQVVLRYVFANSLFWVEDISTIAFVAMIWVAAPALWLSREHLLLDVLPIAHTRAGAIIADAAMIAAGAIAAVASFETAAAFSVLVLPVFDLDYGFKVYPITGGLVLLVIAAAFLARAEPAARAELMFGEFAVLLGVMLLALALGMPVFLCLALSIITYGAVYWPKVPLEIVVQGFLQGIDNYGLVAIPFFFLVGEILNVGGIGRRLVNVATAVVGHVRGGLSHVNVLVSMVFAGISGSAIADASAVGSLMIPAMKRAGYPGPYAAAITAAAATIGPIIPPSIPFVLTFTHRQGTLAESLLWASFCWWPRSLAGAGITPSSAWLGWREHSSKRLRH